MKRKKKKKTWHQLKDDKCPKCNQTLMRDLYGGGLLGCACSFILEEHTKDILVERDKD
jgi:hypothetical protein